MPIYVTPDRAADYGRAHVVNHPAFNPDVESFVVLLLNTRRRVKGNVLVSTGTLDTLLVHPREVFRPAIIAAASAVVIMHNMRHAHRDTNAIQKGNMDSITDSIWIGNYLDAKDRESLVGARIR